jgi:protein O-GlcNAc transferase
MDEAVAWVQRARELDSIGTDGIGSDGMVLFFARRYDESIETLRSLLAVQPADAAAHWDLGYALVAKGQAAQAIPELEEAIRLSDRSSAVIDVLVRAYAHTGRRAAARCRTEKAQSGRLCSICGVSKCIFGAGR